MKNFKNFAIYGLPTCSLSNICAMDEAINEAMGEAIDFLNNNLGSKNNLGNLLVDLTTALVNKNKKQGLDLLNKHIFNINKNIKNLEKHNNIKYKLCEKEGKTNKNLLILFHGLGQEIEEYLTKNKKTGKSDIDILQENFDADVLLIEYDFNGDNNNTFDGIDKYCEEVANFISTELKGYDNFTFFGYSLGSFVGNLTRQKFNNIKAENVKSKYIGYKGIKDLENAGVSFIKTFTKDNGIEITEEGICNFINIALSTKKIGGGKGISIEKFSDLFEYLLGKDEYNKIKTLTTNALILKNTRGFNKDKVVFNDNLVTKDHNINLENDITPILKVFNSDENKNKDVFLFQCNGGDEIVGKGMEDTYESLTGKKPKHTNPKGPKGNEDNGGPKDDEDNGGPKDEHNKINQGGENQGKEEEKTNSCLCF